MPRGKKRVTQSGADAQTIKSVPGQRYGEGKEQQELLEAMPAPNLAADNAPAPAPLQPQGNPVVPAMPGDPDAMKAFLADNNPALLSGTQLPDTPVTDGIAGGPGRGPEALAAGRSTTPLARYLNKLAVDTGNKKWAYLAERAGLQ